MKLRGSDDAIAVAKEMIKSLTREGQSSQCKMV